MVSSLKSKAVAAAAFAAQAHAACTFTWQSTTSDTCDSFAADWGISTAALVAWNPSLGGSCAGFKSGIDYCVESNDPVPTTAPTTTSTTSTKATTTTTPANPPPANAPTPVQDGIASNCESPLQSSRCFCLNMIY